MPSRDEIMLAAARRRAPEDPQAAMRTIRGLMEVARPRGIGPLEVEHAQAMTYLALEALYDAFKADGASYELWDHAGTSIRTWRQLLGRAVAPP